MKESDKDAIRILKSRVDRLGWKLAYENDGRKYLLTPPDNPDCSIEKTGLVEAYHFMHGVEIGYGWKKRDRPF